jgi:hypothetical protein
MPLTYPQGFAAINEAVMEVLDVNIGEIKDGRKQEGDRKTSLPSGERIRPNNHPNLYPDLVIGETEGLGASLPYLEYPRAKVKPKED